MEHKEHLPALSKEEVWTPFNFITEFSLIYIIQFNYFIIICILS